MDDQDNIEHAVDVSRAHYREQLMTSMNMNPGIYMSATSVALAVVFKTAAAIGAPEKDLDEFIEMMKGAWGVAECEIKEAQHVRELSGLTPDEAMEKIKEADIKPIGSQQSRVGFRPEHMSDDEYTEFQKEAAEIFQEQLDSAKGMPVNTWLSGTVSALMAIHLTCHKSTDPTDPNGKNYLLALRSEAFDRMKLAYDRGILVAVTSTMAESTPKIMMH
jgi:hypothetical protein